ncbi:MAG TPA: HAMP domain-containing protein [Hymenobacter sp.]|uniref:HAMP domain-containing protein n=1 Tax=Hymenobacter sp. TaxID=1898978 RepID=UPI002ED9CF17
MPATIKSKLTLGLGFLFLIIVLLSGVGGYFLHRLSRSAEATLRDNYRSVNYARRLANALADLRDARLGAGPAAAPAAEQARQTFERYIAAERQNITEPGEGPLADSVAVGFRQFAAADPAAASSGGLYRQLRRQVDRVASLNLSAIERQSQRTRTVATRTITTLGLLAGLGILATFSFIFAFPDYVTKPVEELTRGIRRLAAGDYTQRLATSEYQEFAEVARAFNDMARKLESYEMADGTPRIDSTGPLDVVTVHRRPGVPPTAPEALEQQRLVQRLREQSRQLQLTADALLAHGAAPDA